MVIWVTSIWVIISGHFDGRNCFLRVDIDFAQRLHRFNPQTKKRLPANKPHIRANQKDFFYCTNLHDQHMFFCDFPTVKHQLENFVISGWGWLPSIHIVKAVGICLNIISGQIIIFHQPRFPWNKGFPLLNHGVRSCEVAKVWPDYMYTSFFKVTWNHIPNEGQMFTPKKIHLKKKTQKVTRKTPGGLKHEEKLLWIQRGHK